MDFEKHIDHLKEITSNIYQSKGISVLVGENGSGKSLIRKLLGSICQSNGHSAQSISMEIRTNPKYEFEALKSIAMDKDYDPTSINTIYLLQQVYENNGVGDFLIIDEPEIGLGEETQLSVCNFINAQNKKDKLLIITHSRLFVENLEFDNFFSINPKYKSKEMWLERTLIPTNLESLEKNANGLYLAIENRIRKNKQN